MSHAILGLHHITAIAGEAQRNYDFYSKVMGLRLVKKTVNFDDPGTYHFYYGDEQGSPGTILTFFPWAHIKRGSAGTGMATEIGYAVPGDSLEFWKNHLTAQRTGRVEESIRFDESILRFEDPDGLRLSLVAQQADDRTGWATASIAADMATKGFHSVTLTVNQLDATAKVLTDILGYRLLRQEGSRYRFTTEADTAALVDIVEDPKGNRGINAGGTNHHVAFRVKNEDALMFFREKVAGYGLHITPKIDRNYFYSLYFREPGGILFEIATDNPGFAVDEPTDQLGTHLKLPPQYEPRRSSIEAALPALIQ